MKKAISILLCLAMVTAMSVVAMAAGGENYVSFSSAEIAFPKNPHIAGDSNGDGVVNVMDAVTSIKLISGTQTGYRYDSVDIDGDGIVSLTDAILIIRHILGEDVGLGKIVS